MQNPTPFDSGARLTGTLKLQSNALGLETAPRSHASSTTVWSPDRWTVVEVSWAAMIKRMQGGCELRVVDATPQSVRPFGCQRAETPIVLPSDKVAQNTGSAGVEQAELADDTISGMLMTWHDRQHQADKS